MEGEPQRPVWHFVCLLNLDSQNWANIEPKAPGNLLPSFCVLLPLPSKTKQSSQADRLIYRWVLQSSKSLTQKNAQFILRWIRKKNGELSEGRGINKHYIHDESKKVLKRVKPLYANLGESVCVCGGGNIPLLWYTMKCTLTFLGESPREPFYQSTQFHLSSFWGLVSGVTLCNTYWLQYKASLVKSDIQIMMQ